MWDFNNNCKHLKNVVKAALLPAGFCSIYCQAFRLMDATCWQAANNTVTAFIHTRPPRSSLPLTSNGFLRNPMVTSQDSVNHGNCTQKPVCIPYVQLRSA